MDRDELLKARDRQQTSFPWVDLRNQDLRSLDLRQCNLRQAKLEGADCSLANLVNACLIKVEAHQVSFEQALLNQVRGTNAILTGANLEAAILSQSDFHKANFQQARLANAQAEQVNFSQSNLVQAECQNILATEADFQEAQLQGGIWVKARLTRANFAGADLTHCNFQGADLRSVDLRDAQLDNTNFSEADLRGAKLTWGTNPLHHANFTGAIMPDGVAFDDQWQPPQIQAKPEPYLRPAPPPAPQTPDRPNRFTLVNPFFEVPGAGPKELPPPPKTLGQWRRRLPWAGLVGLMCAYGGWGAILIHLQAPLTAIALLLLSSFLPAMDVAPLPYIPLMGFVAVILAIPNSSWISLHLKRIIEVYFSHQNQLVYGNFDITRLHL